MPGPDWRIGAQRGPHCRPPSVPEGHGGKAKADLCRILLWLQHLCEVGEDPVLSQPVTVNLKVTDPPPARPQTPVRVLPGCGLRLQQGGRATCETPSGKDLGREIVEGVLAKAWRGRWWGVRGTPSLLPSLLGVCLFSGPFLSHFVLQPAFVSMLAVFLLLVPPGHKQAQAPPADVKAEGGRAATKRALPPSAFSCQGREASPKLSPPPGSRRSLPFQWPESATGLPPAPHRRLGPCLFGTGMVSYAWPPSWAPLRKYGERGTGCWRHSEPPPPPGDAHPTQNLGKHACPGLSVLICKMGPQSCPDFAVRISEELCCGPAPALPLLSSGALG